MNKLSFLAQSTSLVVKELSDLEFSFQSVAKIQKTTNKSTLTCCRHSPTGSSSWLIFWWRKFGFQTVSNWSENLLWKYFFRFHIHIILLYLKTDRGRAEFNIFHVFSNQEFESLFPLLHPPFFRRVHTHFFFSQMFCLQVVIQHEHFAVADNMPYVEYLSMQPIYLQILRRQ